MVAMMKTPDAKLMKADRAKLAAKYGIPQAWVEFWMDQWLAR